MGRLFLAVLTISSAVLSCMTQERRPVPRDKWRIKPGDTLLGNQVISEPWYHGKSQQWVDVRLRCGHVEPRQINRIKSEKTVGRACKKCQAEMQMKNGMKKCSKCLRMLDISLFHNQANTKDGFVRSCHDCNNDNRLHATYGISIADFRKMLLDQGDCCAVCRIGLLDGRAIPAVHHCHDKHVVLAILCHKCNAASGLLNEDPEITERLLCCQRLWLARSSSA